MDDYLFHKDMKFWEARFVLIPSSHPATQIIIAGSDRCDLYTTIDTPDYKPLKLLDSFLKFMEALNRIRRTQTLVRILQNVDKNHDLNVNDFPKIFAAVCPSSSAEKGLNFLSLSSSNRTTEKLFVSAEFVHWLIVYVPEIDTTLAAIEYCQRLLDEGKIRHVSGEQKFIYGFYIYYFVTPTSKDVEGIFYEAAVLDSSCSAETSSNFCPYRFNLRKMDFDPQKRSERTEWGQLRTSRGFCLNSVFEINIQWLVATGAIVNDLIMNLHRKSLVHPLCLLPVPSDPFALPHDPFSDPLRSPILVALNKNIVGHLADDVFQRFQIAILTRFGFLPLSCDVHSQKQFIHMSAGMCVLLNKREGYFWGWNSTLGHRYRSQQTTGDEAFQDKILADFCSFCDNCENRVQNFLDEWLLL